MSRRDLTPETHPHASILQHPGASTPGLGANPAARMHTDSELLLRRLRFYVDLLDTGYHQALRPDPLSRCLRAERIALGIDLPELDVVPLWSVRGRDGSVSVPFVEFILAQIAEALDALSIEASASDPQAAAEISATSEAVVATMRATRSGGMPLQTLPRLHDVYLPSSTLEALCGRDGRLAATVQLCERSLLLEGAGIEH